MFEKDRQVIARWGRNPFSEPILRIRLALGRIRSKELGVRELSVYVVNRARAKLAGKLISRRMLTTARILSPKISSIEVNRSVQHPTEDLPFNNSLVLQGMRVALIGPGFKGTDIATLSSYDVIARINFTGADSTANPEFPRCELSFLTPWHARRLLNCAYDNAIDFDGTKFLLREDVRPEISAALSERLDVIQFSTKPCNRIFKGVTPNFGPQIIVWLLSQRPSELHLSHIDLMTDPRRPAGYATTKRVVTSDSGWQHEKPTVRRAFSQFHNPFTHFSFFESLLEIPSISYSSDLKLIIEQGAEAYSNKISILYFD